MPINVVRSTTRKAKNKFDTSSLVQKPYLRTNYKESNIEEGIDMKNQFTIKNLPDPISIREPASKLYVDNTLNNPSKRKNTAHVDFNDIKIDNVRFVKVNFYPVVGGHRTPKTHADQSRDDTTFVRNNKK